jgi:UDP-3-O-[3-hydroxymyristoyl] N-acetylglucosamine deacetylase/3-hydroxyacyl-[acyl-carrier-protein] dehydratase
MLVDRVLEFSGEDQIVALKNVTINEPYFNGHFPGNPVMPGVLQLEAMAQTAGILMLRKSGSAGKSCLLMSADKVKFRQPVRPGDQLIIAARLVKARAGKFATAACECKVDEQTVSSAELMFAVLDEPADET